MSERITVATLRELWEQVKNAEMTSGDDSNVFLSGYPWLTATLLTNIGLQEEKANDGVLFPNFTVVSRYMDGDLEKEKNVTLEEVYAVLAQAVSVEQSIELDITDLWKRAVNKKLTSSDGESHVYLNVEGCEWITADLISKINLAIYKQQQGQKLSDADYELLAKADEVRRILESLVFKKQKKGC